MERVDVPEWPRPKGYSNGMLTAGEGERLLFVAGQVGWIDEKVPTSDFAEQFALALDNVLAVVRRAGGEPADIARMTVFVTDIPGYRDAQRRLGEIWREKMGRHYPVMSLLGIQELVEDGAKVEIEATAVLPKQR
ncbi:MAG: RidA family protein [Polyangiaceae bacterium]|nr:RidA family protein [Polyangiaceae bacterium]